MTSFINAHSRRSLLIMLFAAAGTNLFAQTTNYPEEVISKIRNVENGLVSWVQTPDKLQWSLEERMDTYNVHGLSIAVINGYEIEWAKTYGWADVGEARRLDLNTMLQAASISKSVNGMGVLKLADEEKIDIERTDINCYLNSWQFPYDSISGNNTISVANLLSHTAGTNVHGFGGYSIRDTVPTLPEILDGTHPANNRPVRSFTIPGEKVQYSGGGVTITQMIVEDVSGMPYEKYMDDKIFSALGMNNSTFSQPPVPAANRQLATGYHRNGSEVKGKYHIYPEKAAAGLWTTPTDLAKFLIEIQLSYSGRSGKVLSAAETRRMLTPVMENAALGTFVQQMGDWTYFVHSGVNEGFVCQYYGTLDGGKGVVVMTNGSNSLLVNELVNSVANAYGWKGFYNPDMRTAITPSDAILDSYAGSYLFNGHEVNVSRKNGELYLVLDFPCQLYFTTEKDFFLSQFRGEYTFLFDDQGEVKGFASGGNVSDKVE